MPIKINPRTPWAGGGQERTLHAHPAPFFPGLRAVEGVEPCSHRLKEECPLNTLSLAHRFLEEHVKPGDFCIDATAGKGRDTAFLCRLVGESGRVLALDIQPEAVEATTQLLRREGFSHRGQVILDSHSHLEQYAAPSSVDGIVFNFGWLPGGDHRISTTPATSIPALEQGLALLRPGGVMSLCIYYGGLSGFVERDALLDYLAAIDSAAYTVLVSQFVNRPGNPPISAFIFKERPLDR